MANEYLILGLSVSIMFNVIWILILIGTGWGRAIAVRWWRQKTYKKGGWVNNLYITNNNVLREIYTRKKDDGSIEVDKEKYSVNPKLHLIFDGIPTQFIRQGVCEPIGFYEDDQSEKMSTAEIKKIITNNQHKNALDLVGKWLLPALIILAVVLIGVMWVAYSNWQMYDVIVQGGTGSIMPR